MRPIAGKKVKCYPLRPWAVTMFLCTENPKIESVSHTGLGIA